MTARVLLAEDDALSRDFLSEALRSLQCDVVAVDDGASALRRLEKDAAPFDLVVTDLRMPRRDGFAVIEGVREMPRAPACVLITAYGSAEVAVEALRRGAADVLFKPVTIDDLETSIERLAKQKRLRAANAMLREQLTGTGGEVVVSDESVEVWNMVDRVAPTPATVLVLGESGSGKELIANALHERSARSDEALISVNCAALPETLIESELFGHEAGAFTGATARKLGRFELAHRGTIFLDEVGELPLALQAKLLRVLETGCFMRVGGAELVSVDVRVVAATNARLADMVHDGRFREDLYYRLNIIPIRVPALRERRDDILPLVDHFLELEAGRLSTEVAEFDAEARSWMRHYDWPGNVRELRNLVQRVLLIAGGARVSRETLVAWAQGASGGLVDFCRDPGSPTKREGAPAAGSDEVLHESLRPWIGRSLRELEDAFISATLDAVGGQRKQAACSLGIAPRTLYNRLRDLNAH